MKLHQPANHLLFLVWSTFLVIAQGQKKTNKKIFNYTGLVYPCEIPNPGNGTPTSVHTLRPSDIRAIGAMGDSLTSGLEAWLQVLLLTQWIIEECLGVEVNSLVVCGLNIQLAS